MGRDFFSKYFRYEEVFCKLFLLTKYSDQFLMTEKSILKNKEQRDYITVSE